MRPEPAPPDEAALDLLAHADALARAAANAIAAGDDVALAALLEERGIVVAAAIAALTQLRGAPARPEVTARLAAAARGSVSSGLQAQAAAQRAREQAAADLALLDARHQAGFEYQIGPAQTTIDVVL
jgi:hypothetical protein